MSFRSFECEQVGRFAMVLVSTFLLFNVVIGIFWAGIQWWRKWRKMPPGPYGVPFLGYLPYMACSKHPVHLHLLKTLHKKYGPIVSVSAAFQDLILVSDSDILKELYAKDEVLARPDIATLRILSGGGGHVHGSGKMWQENRKFAVRFFREHLFKDTEKLNKLSMENVEEAVEVFNKNLDRPFDIGITFNVCMIKTLYSVIAKTNFSMLYPFVVRKLLESIAKGEELVFQMWLPECLTNLSPIVWKNISCLVEMSEWLDQLAFEDIASERQRKSLDTYIGQYLEQIEVQPEYFSEMELVRNIRSLFAAGAETTATAMNWAMKHLVDYPEVQRRCRQEIDDVIGHERLPHVDDLVNLPYMNAFIEENDRLSAVLPIILRSSTADCYCRGYLIPKGSWCLANVVACQRNEELFPEPDVCKPERFLDENSNFVKRTQGMISFGSGKRRCFGENLARIQLGLYLTTFLQKFEFLKPPGSEDKKIKPRPYNQINYAPPFQILIQKRAPLPLKNG